MVPIVSLERWTTVLRLDEIKANCARFRALGADVMTGRLPSVLRHQSFQLSFRSLVLEKGLPGATE
jgi:hypothetical protein